ncbi:MAG: 4Fe-4S binding protein [Gemmatimonadota bacterium]|nr:4Fe-4S binding protein [Gemmatimonadota bacterium]
MPGVRKIIQIDEEKCNGCGLCVPSCAEGAIQIVDGKARLVSDVYCDGLGACLGDCPEDAIRIIEREAEDFDEQAVKHHLAGEEDRKEKLPKRMSQQQAPVAHRGCPGTLSRMISPQPLQADTCAAESGGGIPSNLGNWPVQLMLAPVSAPYFDGADLLISADCVPFALADFHREFLEGKTLLIGCPKLDQVAHYHDKLAQIFSLNEIRSIEVLIMEVPCCSGLNRLVGSALARANKDIPATVVKVSIRGEVIEKQALEPSVV